jgi:hypothetical protein
MIEPKVEDVKRTVLLKAYKDNVFKNTIFTKIIIQ